jgi:hypothetical protein
LSILPDKKSDWELIDVGQKAWSWKVCGGSMNFEVYCDESRPDLLSSEHSQARFMVIGSLWLREGDRQTFKAEIHAMRNKYKMGGEFKWQKVSPSRLDFYKALVEWFSQKGEDLRFRCIAVEKDKVNLKLYHDNDQELGFYKFYYQLLHHWILDCNQYAIFLDFKSNRLRDRLPVLRRVLDLSNLSSIVSRVQSIRSEESVLIQLADVLTGAASARLNDALSPDSAKFQLLSHLESCLGRKIAATYKGEQKFNVFVINLQGGW